MRHYIHLVSETSSVTVGPKISMSERQYYDSGDAALCCAPLPQLNFREFLEKGIRQNNSYSTVICVLSILPVLILWRNDYMHTGAIRIQPVHRIIR